MRVLLVEDDPDDAFLIKEMLLEQKGVGTCFALQHVTSLYAALEYLVKGPLNAVLLDLGLPDSQGLETVRRIVPPASGAPVIVLTGLNDEAMGIQAIHEGAQDYLIKGEITFPVIRRAINYAIERQKLLKEIKVLRGILPICSYCKKIRDDKGYWEQMEMYIRDHSEAEFSHGMCPACAEKVFQELDEMKKRKKEE